MWTNQLKRDTAKLRYIEPHGIIIISSSIYPRFEICTSNSIRIYKNGNMYTLFYSDYVYGLDSTHISVNWLDEIHHCSHVTDGVARDSNFLNKPVLAWNRHLSAHRLLVSSCKVFNKDQKVHSKSCKSRLWYINRFNKLCLTVFALVEARPLTVIRCNWKFEIPKFCCNTGSVGTKCPLNCMWLLIKSGVVCGCGGLILF